MARLTKSTKQIILGQLAAEAEPCTTITVDRILDSEDGCLLVQYTFDGEQSSCVYYPAQHLVVSLHNWQGDFPTTIDEIGNYLWR